jgi:hypothetical protein
MGGEDKPSFKKLFSRGAAENAEKSIRCRFLDHFSAVAELRFHGFVPPGRRPYGPEA